MAAARRSAALQKVSGDAMSAQGLIASSRPETPEQLIGLLFETYLEPNSSLYESSSNRRVAMCLSL